MLSSCRVHRICKKLSIIINNQSKSTVSLYYYCARVVYAIQNRSVNYCKRKQNYPTQRIWKGKDHTCQELDVHKPLGL